MAILLEGEHLRTSVGIRLVKHPDIRMTNFGHGCYYPDIQMAILSMDNYPDPNII
ncbi:14322_t:CDS:2 [Cetraspora pellucida]|uniref:14322_t:CDS:1 n=1 Tax=Cetraspora pellucida TaxID=1433469 RepID=A0A9N8VPC2_9GLOM|nr:14322_t:CDS:2 [Cetraspora pellucida]